MEFKFCVVFFSIFCAQALSAPALFEFGASTPYDFLSRVAPSPQLHAQFGNVQCNAGVSILRLRAFLVATDMHFTVRNNNQIMFEMMATLGVPAVTIDSVKSEYDIKGEKAIDNLVRVVQITQDMSDLLASINNNIVHFPDRLSTDLLLFNSQASNVENTVASTWDNVGLTVALLKLRVENAIEPYSGPEKQQILDLLTESEAVVNRLAARTREDEVDYKASVVLAKTTLEVLIAAAK